MDRVHEGVSIEGKAPMKKSGAMARIQRGYGSYLAIRFQDPTRRAAQAHLHVDTDDVARRVGRFLAAPADVRRQVLVELHRKVELASPGNFSPALSAFLGTVAVSATLFATLIFALLNGWFGAVARVTDPATGVAAGVSQLSFNTTLGGFAQLITVVAALVLFLSALGIAIARQRDGRRATLAAWKTVYEEALLLRDMDVKRVRADRRWPLTLFSIVSRSNGDVPRVAG